MESKRTILIADPDGVWRASVARLLSTEGFDVLQANSGIMAIYLAQMRRPELILLSPDLCQPTGWEVCRRLRRAPETQNLKIVLLTLNGEHAHRAGADGYLIKGAQSEPTLPPVHAFRHPAPGILGEFRHRRHALAA
jgi:two-component system phosphate regulon response regulator PhoB